MAARRKKRKTPTRKRRKKQAKGSGRRKATRRRKPKDAPQRSFGELLPEPVEHFFRRHPHLRKVYRDVKKRLSRIPGVVSVGIGVPYSDKERRFKPGHRDLGGFCLKVFVERKRRRADVPKGELVPDWIAVDWPGRKRKMRVPTDVVGMGTVAGFGAPAEQSAGRPWPRAGAILPGRTFSFRRNQTTSRTAEIGTCGCLFTMPPEGELYASSAGHVFTVPCCRQYDRPSRTSGLGVQGKACRQIRPSAFAPVTIKPKEIVRDAMVFLVPASVMPKATATHDDLWPAGFEGEIATDEDRASATRLTVQNKSNGFIAVERRTAGGAIKRVRLNIRLEGAVDLKPQVKCVATTQARCPQLPAIQKKAYGWVWSYRYSSASAIGGDSGSAVYLTPDGTRGTRPRTALLGFHFMKIGGRGYCVDAASYTAKGLGKQGVKWEFFKAKRA